MKLSTNWTNILLRFVMLASVIAFVALIIYKPLQSVESQKYIFWKIKAGYILYVLIFVLACLFYLVSASFLGVIRVEIDTITDTITFIGVSNKRTITINEINNYSITLKNNGFKKFSGLLLKLKDNKEIQLAEQNLVSLNDLKEFLIEKNINYNGEIKPKLPFN